MLIINDVNDEFDKMIFVVIVSLLMMCYM